MKSARGVCMCLAVCVAAYGCRSSGSERLNRPNLAGNQARNQYIIEAEELKGTDAVSLYDAVRMRRPNWLTRTGRNTSRNALSVYLDERPIGSLSILREMPIHVAQALQFLTPTEAQLRFGPTHGSSAAIVVVSARP